MRALLDTSVVIRYLTGDVPHLAEWCAQVIDSEDDLTVTEGVMIETAYVLTKNYSVPREVAVDVLIEFLGKSNINVTPLTKPLVIEALLMCRPSGRVSFGDALLWARSRSDGLAVCTLDERFVDRGITTLRPQRR
ncbi:MAG: PIN domain-containing protein [bacterium]|nr:PIN domain-containing protein [bacterium]MDE0600969.1 PIN domain-containing protein [bacterium]